MIATGLVFSKWENTITKQTVIGILNSMPVTPQIAPQISKEAIATKGLIFKVFPIIFGSKMLPIITWILPTINSTNKLGVNSPNCSKQNTAGKIVAIKEPIVGIKFKIKIKNAQNKGESIPINNRAK